MVSVPWSIAHNMYILVNTEQILATVIYMFILKGRDRASDDGLWAPVSPDSETL
jgi:hypothetical protein